MSNDGGRPPGHGSDAQPQPTPPGPQYGDAPRYGYGPSSAASASSAPDPHRFAAQGHVPPASDPAAGSYPPPPSGYPAQGWPQPGPNPGGPQAGPAYPPGGYSSGPYAAGPQPYAPAVWTQAWVPPNLAGWGRRVGANLIDFAPGLVGVIIFYVGYLQWIFALTTARSSSDLSVLNTGTTPMIIGGVIMLVAIGWDIYNRWLTGGRTGQSLGKRVLKIALISEQTGQPIGALNAFLRDLVHTLDGMLYIGYLWPLWDERKQTFADKIMKTYVVTTEPTARVNG